MLSFILTLLRQQLIGYRLFAHSLCKVLSLLRTIPSLSLFPVSSRDGRNPLSPSPFLLKHFPPPISPPPPSILQGHHHLDSCIVPFNARLSSFPISAIPCLLTPYCIPTAPSSPHTHTFHLLHSTSPSTPPTPLTHILPCHLSSSLLFIRRPFSSLFQTAPFGPTQELSSV